MQKGDFLELYAILSTKKSIKCTTVPPEIAGANIPSDSTERMCPRIEIITYPHVSAIIIIHKGDGK